MGNEELLSKTLDRVQSLAERMSETSAERDKLSYEVMALTLVVERLNDALDNLRTDDVKPLRMSLFGNGDVSDAIVTRVGKLEEKCEQHEKTAKSRSKLLTGIITALIVVVLARGVNDYMDAADRGNEPTSEQPVE